MLRAKLRRDGHWVRSLTATVVHLSKSAPDGLRGLEVRSALQGLGTGAICANLARDAIIG